MLDEKLLHFFITLPVLRKEQILHLKFYVAKGSEVFSRTVAETSKSTIIFQTIFLGNNVIFFGPDRH